MDLHLRIFNVTALAIALLAPSLLDVRGVLGADKQSGHHSPAITTATGSALQPKPAGAPVRMSAGDDRWIDIHDMNAWLDMEDMNWELHSAVFGLTVSRRPLLLKNGQEQGRIHLPEHKLAVKLAQACSTVYKSTSGDWLSWSNPANARQPTSPGRCPGETDQSWAPIGPTGQSFVERLAHWAENTGSTGPASPGRCPGLGEPCPFGAVGMFACDVPASDVAHSLRFSVRWDESQRTFVIDPRVIPERTNICRNSFNSPLDLCDSPFVLRR
jgi:hypothetical protein